MSRTPFKERIRSGEPALGTLITVGAPAIAEALSNTGLDWLFIDLEHGSLGLEAAEDTIRAAHSGCSTMVRVPENSPVWLHKALDLGCDGVIVPMVCSEAEALHAVEHSLYPPKGRRSVGVARAHDYGLNFGEYVANANERISVIVQIEHVDGVRNLDPILAVPGIDGVLIGPYDLSGSMGLLGQVDHPEVRNAMATIRTTCARHDIPFGLFVRDAGGIEAALASGVNFLAVGTDLSLMCDSVHAVIEAVARV